MDARNRYAPFIKGHLAQAEHLEAAIRERKARAEAAVHQAVKHLVERYDVTAIWLLGSLVYGSFGSESDIDLAVQGLEPRDFFRAYSEIRRFSEVPVDLLALETLDPEFAERIWAEGVVLYERPGREKSSATPPGGGSAGRLEGH